MKESFPIAVANSEPSQNWSTFAKKCFEDLRSDFPEFFANGKFRDRSGFYEPASLEQDMCSEHEDHDGTQKQDMCSKPNILALMSLLQLCQTFGNSENFSTFLNSGQIEGIGITVLICRSELIANVIHDLIAGYFLKFPDNAFSQVCVMKQAHMFDFGYGAEAKSLLERLSPKFQRAIFTGKKVVCLLEDEKEFPVELRELGAKVVTLAHQDRETLQLYFELTNRAQRDRCDALPENEQIKKLSMDQILIALRAQTPIGFSRTISELSGIKLFPRLHNK